MTTIKRKRVVQIATGRNADSILHHPLADYCHRRGWRVVREVVSILLPEGKELEQLQSDLKAGIVEIVSQEDKA